RDFFGLGDTSGETGAELYLFAEAIGRINPPKLMSTPVAASGAAAAVSPAVTVGAVDVARIAPAVSLMASHAASSKESKASGAGSSGGSQDRPPSVDPLGEPFPDPAPKKYKAWHPSYPVVDHVKNRARGGHATSPRNLDLKTWEANSRKAGFEGNY